MTQSTYTKPLPRPNRLSKPYWDAAREHKLVVLHCKDGYCNTKWMPPSDRCPTCLKTDIEWIPASGRGKIWSWVIFHQPYIDGFKGDLPYNVAYVELEEGPLCRLVTNLVECDPKTLKCDMPVEVVFDDVTPEITLPKFRPVAQ